MQEILDAINAGATGDDIANIELPETYRAAHVLRSEQEMWQGVESADKDPRKSLHVGEVPLPDLAPNEVVIANMASSINFNTVWTSIFEPLPTSDSSIVSARSRSGASGMPRTSTWSDPIPRVWCCGWAPRCATGPPATT
ncbi:MAG: hypothetical protein R2789_17845 [Microthrixaceae bacterium]